MLRTKGSLMRARWSQPAAWSLQARREKALEQCCALDLTREWGAQRREPASASQFRATFPSQIQVLELDVSLMVAGLSL